MLYQIETIMLIVDRVLLSFLFHLLNVFSPSSLICLIFFFVSVFKLWSTSAMESHFHQSNDNGSNEA